MGVTNSSPFGGQTRTRALLALQLMGSSYARELSRLLGTSLAPVQRALRGLELDGLVAARTAGRTRLFTLNPAYFARRELAAYLERLADADDALQRAVASLRRLPETRRREVTEASGRRAGLVAMSALLRAPRRPRELRTTRS